MKKVLGVISVLALTTAAWATFTIAPAASATATGFTVDVAGPNNGKLYSIDLSTGTPTEIGPTGQDDIEGLTLACDGTLYGVNRAAQSEETPNQQPDQLITINKTTGAPTVVGPLSVSPADAGLTFGTDGKLYMAEVNTGRFYEVNKTTAAVTDIGPMGGGVEITGLATRANGTIFGYDRSGDHFQLVTINRATGAAAVVGPASDLNLIGLDFDAAGTLWGISGTGKIVTFNTATGADTQVTTYNLDQHQFVSLAITPPACPPSAPKTPDAPPAEAVAAVVQLTG
jgi:sugar lactone lactonase YvrE